MLKYKKYTRKEILNILLKATSNETGYYTIGNTKIVAPPNMRRLKNFVNDHNLTDKYPVKDLERWHMLLTSSCTKGRKEFVESHKLNMEKDELTIPEFFEMVKGSYATDIIEIVEELMEEKAKLENENHKK
jgi:hypothetical protein